MMTDSNIKCFIDKISTKQNLLFVQDIDGVCIPLVKDPLNRTISKDYVNDVSRLNEDFMVLTCGEHEGERGVNRIIERAFNSKLKVRKEGLYLPGLAACGVEYQDNYGNVTCPGVSKEEKVFLEHIPYKMESLLNAEIAKVIPNISKENVAKQAKKAICDTRFSPTINLNELFILAGENVSLKIELQKMMERVMINVISYSKECNLGNSFYLHKSPNLGSYNGNEIMKFANTNDIGTTDIQLIINGALKEAGLLVIINKYIEKKTGIFPLGTDFNVRDAPKSIEELVKLCRKSIKVSEMPTIIGIGDTITSIKDLSKGKWMRGGSDRGFLTLIQELGIEFRKDNKVIFVDSSDGEVERPSVKDSLFNGITDHEDSLKFDLILDGGHKQYIKFFKHLTSSRLKQKHVIE